MAKAKQEIAQRESRMQERIASHDRMRAERTRPRWREEEHARPLWTHRSGRARCRRSHERERRPEDTDRSSRREPRSSDYYSESEEEEEDEEEEEGEKEEEEETEEVPSVEDKGQEERSKEGEKEPKEEDQRREEKITDLNSKGTTPAASASAAAVLQVSQVSPPDLADREARLFSCMLSAALESVSKHLQDTRDV